MDEAFVELRTDVDRLQEVVADLLDARWKQAAENFGQLDANIRSINDRLTTLETAVEKLEKSAHE